jgi:hypothetical protein
VARAGAGPDVLRQEQGALLGEDQIKTTFADVAGVDEAKEDVRSSSSSCAIPASSRSSAAAFRAAC